MTNVKYAFICRYRHGDQFETICDTVDSAVAAADREWKFLSEKEKASKFDYFGVMSGTLDEDDCFDCNTAEEVLRYDVLLKDEFNPAWKFDDFEVICECFYNGNEGFLVSHDHELYFMRAEEHFFDNSLDTVDSFRDLERIRDTDYLDESDLVRDKDYRVIDLAKILEEI